MKKHRLALVVLLAAFASLLMATSASAGTPSVQASQNCGKAFGLALNVTKGKVSCRTAKKVVKAGFGQKGCGVTNRRPCTAYGYRCRNDVTDAREVQGYCYVAKRSKKLSQDFRLYNLSLFKKAIALG